MAEIRWTVEQSRALRSTVDTLLVANAGTGKTTTVVGKVLWLLGLPFGQESETGDPLPPPPEEQRAELHEIAAITFTEKAAADLKRQLRERIEASPRADELRWQLDRASIGTIHSFCAELLREHALRLGIDPTFDVLDANEAWAEQDALIKELVLERLEDGDPAVADLLRDMKLADGEYTKGVVGHVRDVLSDLRWHGERYERWLLAEGESGETGPPAWLDEAPPPGLPPGEPASGVDEPGQARDPDDTPESPDGPEPADTPDPVLDLDALRAATAEWDDADDLGLRTCDTLLRLALEALERWESFLREENARDFDSLILDARELLRGDDGEAAKGGIRDRYRILIIDEFQDTDFAQRDIAFEIGRGVERPQLFLVGDPKQSIYRFRGADISVWNRVQEELAHDGAVLDLSRNFRCAPVIVDFVNQAAGAAMVATGERVAEEEPGSRVRYATLQAGLEATEAAAVEWLEVDEENAADTRDAEARHVASRILELVDDLEIPDPDSGDPRKLEFRDCALLYRARTGLEHYETALTRYGIPYFLSGAPHLNERQEILDILNALRVIRAPRDDLRAFAFLRSPFVGLRDETLARIRLLGRSRSAPVLIQARRFLQSDDPWPAPEHPELAAIERDALARGLATLDDLRQLAPRVPLDELMEELLERTGYRLHLLLMDRAEEPLANLDSLLHFAEGHRDLDINAFLQVWDRHASQDAGLPQAPLYSKEDDVVTLSTVHRAKGLEWPVVFLVGVDKALWVNRSNEFWSDRALGPVLCPRKSDRGPRAARLHERARRQAVAEEARLLYVATTRARDRLVVVGPRGEEGKENYAAWLEHGVSAEHVPTEIRQEPGDVQPRAVAAPPELSWLDALEPAAPPPLVRPLPEPDLRWFHSATELMTRAEDPDAWERRYRHGIQAPWEFAPESTGNGDDRLPPTLRGTVIHGVLERIQEANELSRVLDETIGALDEPELEQLLAPETDYRQALEEEIRRVVDSEEWRWYVQGPHWRELEFFHLAEPRNWRLGAFDLYRRRDDESDLIVDFKTHPIERDAAERVAERYRTQVRIYGEAGEIAGPVSVRLHFTKPNVLVELED